MARVSPEDFPDPTVDAPLADKPGQSRAILAGGCFWCVEAVYKNLEGVSSVKSGYAGGSAETADYETVSTGTTNHAESVEVTYDPSRLSYGQKAALLSGSSGKGPQPLALSSRRRRRFAGLCLSGSGALGRRSAARRGRTAFGPTRRCAA